MAAQQGAKGPKEPKIDTPPDVTPSGGPPQDEIAIVRGALQNDLTATEFYMGTLYNDGDCLEAKSALNRLRRLASARVYPQSSFEMITSRFDQFCGVKRTNKG